MGGRRARVRRDCGRGYGRARRTTRLVSPTTLWTDAFGRGCRVPQLRDEGDGLTAVMAMTVDRTFTRAFTASADHRIVRIDVQAVRAQRGDFANCGFSVLADDRRSRGATRCTHTQRARLGTPRWAYRATGGFSLSAGGMGSECPLHRVFLSGSSLCPISSTAPPPSPSVLSLRPVSLLLNVAPLFQHR